MPLRGSKVESARRVLVIASERVDPPRVVAPLHTEFPLRGVDVCSACCQLPHLRVYAALSLHCGGAEANSVCGLKPLVYEALSY